MSITCLGEANVSQSFCQNAENASKCSVASKDPMHPSPRFSTKLRPINKFALKKVIVIMVPCYDPSDVGDHAMMSEHSVL